MIQCDECYLVVTKIAYCSDACKQKAYRKTKTVFLDDTNKGPAPISSIIELKKATVKPVKIPKKPCRHGLTFCRECV
jgi:hypothetical protein